MSDFNKFGISQEDSVQLGIFRFIAGLITPPIEIVDIAHKPYTEIYTFKDDGVYADINITFNGKGKISQISNNTKTGISELGIRIKEILSPLKGKQFSSKKEEVSPQKLKEISFLFYDFFISLKNILSKKGIESTLTRIEDYCFTISFSNQSNVTCVFRMYFNSKQEITKATAVNENDNKGLCSIIRNAMQAIKDKGSEPQEKSSSSNNLIQDIPASPYSKMEDVEFVEDDEPPFSF